MHCVVAFLDLFSLLVDLPSLCCRLTIVGGGRDAWSVWARGTQSILRARGPWLAWSSGPSTSPLGGPCSMSAPTDLVLTCVPSLVATLLRHEQDKGSP